MLAWHRKILLACSNELTADLAQPREHSIVTRPFQLMFRPSSLWEVHDYIWSYLKVILTGAHSHCHDNTTENALASSCSLEVAGPVPHCKVLSIGMEPDGSHPTSCVRHCTCITWESCDDTSHVIMMIRVMWLWYESCVHDDTSCDYDTSCDPDDMSHVIMMT